MVRPYLWGLLEHDRGFHKSPVLPTDDAHKTASPIDHADASITPAKLKATNAAADTQVPSYDAASQLFKWIASGGGPAFSGLQLVADVSTSSAEYIDFTNLDVNTDGQYLMLLNLFNPLFDTGIWIYLYANGNFTGTDYWTQRMSADGTTLSGAKDNDAHLMYMVPFRTFSAMVWISLARRQPSGGYFCAMAQPLVQSGDVVYVDNRNISSTAVIDNITSLRVLGDDTFAGRIFLFRARSR